MFRCGQVAQADAASRSLHSRSADSPTGEEAHFFSSLWQLSSNAIGYLDCRSFQHLIPASRTPLISQVQPHESQPCHDNVRSEFKQVTFSQMNVNQLQS